MKCAYSLSYCADHRKGFPDDYSIPGDQHARMLRDTVDCIRSEVDWPIIVCMTAFAGITETRVAEDWLEREYLWDVWRKAKIVHQSGNPGHQQGASWGIRMGIEAASKLGCDYLVHGAEDLLPDRGVIQSMVDQMERERSDYVGEPWGINRDQLNAQFFGCRVSWFATFFEGGVIGHCTERYMADLVYGHRRRTSLIERVYRHTHDAGEHRRWIEEINHGLGNLPKKENAIL